MKKLILTTSILAFAFTKGDAQVGIGVTTANINSSAQLDISSTTKGLLPPRMTTTQRDAISSPASGLVIFNSTTNSLEYKSSTGWVSLTAAASAVTPDAMPTVQIGTQKWMKENLDVAYYRNGDPIPYVSDPSQWIGLTTGAWCYYNNDPANGAISGKLYNWYAVNDSRGLAPTGWHVPTDAEWATLSSTLGGDAVAGGKMKSGASLTSSGFAGILSGVRYSDDGGFGDNGITGHWWGSPQASTTAAFSIYLYSGNSNFYYGGSDKKQGCFVRCLRD